MLGSKLDIMNSGWLNLVFANRNQAYGAYKLREDNARNTNKALIIAITVFLFVMATPTIINIIKGYIPNADPKVVPVENTYLPPPATIAPVVPPPPMHQAARPHDDMIRDFPPVVTRDNLAHEDPPTDEQLTQADPGPQTQKGDGNMPLSIDEDHGDATVAAVTENTGNDAPFSVVEIEPAPIGGMEKFYSFLGDKIKYPAAAKDAGTQGNVILTFVVEKDGSLTNIIALRDPGNGLANEAIRVLKLAPHWTAGVQNGKKVRVQFTLPVRFSLGE